MHQLGMNVSKTGHDVGSEVGSVTMKVARKVVIRMTFAESILMKYIPMVK